MATTVTSGITRPPEQRWRQDPQTHTMGVAFAVAAIGMLFIALTSSYIVRQGLGMDWQHLPMPRILLVNSVVLLISSVTMELARLARRRGNLNGSSTWTFVTLLLGLSFLTGQLLAWQSLSNRGFFLSTNPHSSFFYVLTGLHGVHLAGGLLALGYVATGSLQQLRELDRRGRWLDGTAIYWHFMDALWIYLLVLLFVWG